MYEYSLSVKSITNSLELILTFKALRNLILFEISSTITLLVWTNTLKSVVFFGAIFNESLLKSIDFALAFTFIVICFSTPKLSK